MALSSPLLTATALVKQYQPNQVSSVPALHSVSLAVEPGEFVTIMGPSGSGKTTLLNCLSGLDAPTSGTVILDRQTLTGMPEKVSAAIRLHKVGFVFQHPTFLPTLSILDNIVLPGILTGTPRAEVVARARDLMGSTEIADLADRNITQVSGGQLQRAAIFRALINTPAILFGDEPTGALHQTAAGEVLALLADVGRDGTTIVLVTRDVRVAARSHRVLVMIDGEVVSEQHLGQLPNGETDPARLTEREETLSRWLLGAGV